MTPNSVLLVCSLLLGVFASYSESDTQQASGFPVGRSLFGSDGDARVIMEVVTECFHMDFLSCMKRKVLIAVDRASRTFGDIKLSDSVYFVRNQNADKETDKDADNVIPRSDDNRLDGLLWKRIGKFLHSHNIRFSLQWLMPGYALQFSENKDDRKAVDLFLVREDEASGRALDTGRGKGEGGDDGGDYDYDEYGGDDGGDKGKGDKGDKKGKGGSSGGGMMMMVKMKMITLFSIACGALALMSGKAIMISLMAMVLSIVLGKKHTSEHSTYEIVSHPQYSHSHSHSHSSHEEHGGGGGGGGGGGYFRRNMMLTPEEEAIAHQLSYDNYIPPTVTNYS